VIEWETYPLDCRGLGAPNQFTQGVREGRIVEICFGPMFPCITGAIVPGYILGAFDFAGVRVPEKEFVISLALNALGGQVQLNPAGPFRCDYTTSGELIFGHSAANGMCCFVSFGYEVESQSSRRAPLPVSESVREL